MKVIEKAHSLTIDDTLKALNTSMKGLSQEEALERQRVFGKNQIAEKRQSKFLLFLEQFNNILIYVLIGASVLSALSAKWADFFVIFILILLNGILSFSLELKALISIKALKKLIVSKKTVVRNGQAISLPSSELVPGDYVWLQEGDAVTADIRLCESSSLHVDESTLTGESLPVIKDHTLLHADETPIQERTNMLFAGTTVVRGWGRGVVVGTANETYFASIVEKGESRASQSPLTLALNFFAQRYILLLAVLFSFVGLYGFYQGRDWFSMVYIFVAQMVAAVPEGLPIVVTLLMATGALKLSQKKTYIRYLPAVETLGSATFLAIDKTGTITEGKVEVHEFFAFDENKIQQIASLCNDTAEGSNDPIDRALAMWVKDFDNMHKKFPRFWVSSFDVKKRMMAVASKIGDDKRLFVKGAFEEISKFDKNENRKKNLEEKIINMTKRGLRVLAFAEGEFVEENPKNWNLEIVGLVGFIDPAKKGVKEAVLEVQAASIHVLMITGDHPLTAQKIAEDVGIAKKEHKVLTGIMIDNLSDDELYQALKNTAVVARALPEHKFRVVQVLQDHKEVVAVTGDGVNDVPALKTADLSIAMGKGSEAAISVSKMVIKDNDLSIIVDAIRGGRVLADNIRKVIYYLLSTAVMEIIFISFAIFAGLPLPLSAIQILWINLATDGVQDKTFIFIKEEGDVMARAPRAVIKQFFDFSQIFRMSYFALLFSFMALFVYWQLIAIYSPIEAQTIIFTSVVCLQWINGIQSQKEKEPFFKNLKRSFTINPYLFLGIALGLALQFCALNVLGDYLGTVPLTLEQWGYPIGLCVIGFFILEIRKWVEYLLSKKQV